MGVALTPESTTGDRTTRGELPAKGELAPVGYLERFGLQPPGNALQEVRKAVLGTDGTPRTVWGPSSVRIFKPRIGLPTWFKRRRPDGLVPIYNFVNRNRPPADTPYSVKVDICEDFRGGQWTYDSHVGTDFALPVGTPLTTTAPGKVLRVARELDHGGLKVCIDHGRGLFTTSGHLSRALVAEGQTVGRGEVIGLSGASGVEFLLFFPWVAPHLHLNVWSGGEVVDPFARHEETSWWRRRNDPVPYSAADYEGQADAEPYEPSEWDPTGVADAIEACRDPEVRQVAASFPSLERRAAEILFWRNLTPAAFEAFPSLYKSVGDPRPVLDMPLRDGDARGVWLPEGYAE
ncbi:MAG: hypothetical protein JJLCMIEE_02420 [Acidimicrobiales bacterium]|nr:hypothetical protein [Acidimicrobiales bacterium]